MLFVRCNLKRITLSMRSNDISRAYREKPPANRKAIRQAIYRCVFGQCLSTCHKISGYFGYDCGQPTRIFSASTMRLNSTSIESFFCRWTLAAHSFLHSYIQSVCQSVIHSNAWQSDRMVRERQRQRKKSATHLNRTENDVFARPKTLLFFLSIFTNSPMKCQPIKQTRNCDHKSDIKNSNWLLTWMLSMC